MEDKAEPASAVKHSHSFWLEDPIVAKHSKHRTTPDLPAAADVVIIGGGISGAALTYWLTKAGIAKVVVLEARGICEGATGRNGGHCWPSYKRKAHSKEEEANIAYEHMTYNLLKSVIESDTEGLSVEELGGLPSGATADANGRIKLADFVQYKATGAISLAYKCAIIKLQKKADEYAKTVKESANCSAISFLDRPALEARLHLRSKTQKKGVPRESVFLGGLHTPDAAQLWPARLVIALMLKSLKNGANFQSHTKVLSRPVKTPEGFLIETERGKIKAKVVIYAINAYSSSLLPFLQAVIKPVRGQMVVTSPLPIVSPVSLGFHGGDDYFIQRFVDGRIAFGGQRRAAFDGRKEEGTANDGEVNPHLARALRTFLVNTFDFAAAAKAQGKTFDPDSIRFEREWTGIMGFSRDEKPLIGALGDQGEFILAGYTGHGMAYTFQASHDIATLVRSFLRKDSVSAASVAEVNARLKGIFDPLRFPEVAQAVQARAKL